MTKQEFREWTNEGIVFLDGATGSNLLKRGMPADACPEQWAAEHGDVLAKLQREYVKAGSDIIYAPTFAANRLKMSDYGLADRVGGINTALVALSKMAAAGRAYVAGNLTMTGAQPEPVGNLTFRELYEIYREQVSFLAEAGVDLLAVETMLSLSEARAAVLAAGDVCPEIPVMATMSFEESGSTLYGVSAESAVVALTGLGADAVGFNCSAGPDRMLDVIRRMKAVAEVPLIAKPNAGLPRVGADAQTVYDMDAARFAGCMRRVADEGACIVGGCCGTSPEYIRRLREELRGRKFATGTPRKASRPTQSPSSQDAQTPQEASSPAGIAAGGGASESSGDEAQTGDFSEPFELGLNVAVMLDSDMGDAAGADTPSTEKVFRLADERKVYPFRDGQVLELGKGIDLCADEELLAECRGDVFDRAQSLVLDLQSSGADAILLCANGLEDEADLLLAIAADVPRAAALPVVVASADPAALSRFLMEYHGIAGVMPPDENPAIEKAVKRYGARLVTLDNKIRCC